MYVGSLHLFEFILLLLFGFGMFVHLSGFFFALWFYHKKAAKLPDEGPYPGITVVKTCVGDRDGERENFDMLFHQDYPGEIQIIFTVPNTECVANEIIDYYMERYPEADTMKVISNTRLAAHRKVDALYDAHPHIKHEYVLWADSDVIMRDNYLSEVVGALMEPGNSLVTSPQFDYRVNNFATALKAVGNNADQCAIFMYYLFFIKRMRLAVGQMLAFKKSEFDEMADEIWSTLRHFVVDDLGMPYLFDKHDKKVVFKNIYNPVEFKSKTLSEMFDQKKRHSTCQIAGIGFRPLYALFPISYAQLPATIWLLTHWWQPSAWLIFVSPFIIRTIHALLSEYLYLGSVKMTLRYFWTLPIWDVLQLYFVLSTVFAHKIYYHGRCYKLVNRYFLEEISPNVTQNDKELLQSR
jgi:ceramide glucosyltransferase